MCELKLSRPGSCKTCDAHVSNHTDPICFSLSIDKNVFCHKNDVRHHFTQIIIDLLFFSCGLILNRIFYRWCA